MSYVTKSLRLLLLLSAIAVVVSIGVQHIALAGSMAQGGGGSGGFGNCPTDKCREEPGPNGYPVIVCDGVPDYPACLNRDPSSSICTPGQTRTYMQCSAANGDLTACNYTCESDSNGVAGWGSPLCVNIQNGYNWTPTETFCDASASAGCGTDGSGRAIGRLTTVERQCVIGSSPLVTVRQEACGTCSLDCPPGGPCPTSVVPPTSVPPPNACPKATCSQSGPCSWSCSWNGNSLTAMNAPIPSIERQPFPRGMVGIPNVINITSGCIGSTGGPNGISRELTEAPFLTCDSTDIYGYRVAWTWMCGSPGAPGDLGATWTMDERSWNVGQRNERGEQIENTHGGSTIVHTYETSSYDKPMNGPGTDSRTRQPAYQITLQTNWLLGVNFERRIKRQESGCWHADSDTEAPDQWDSVSPCLSEDDCRVPSNATFCAAINRRQRTTLSWVSDGSATYATTVTGAQTPQDPVSAGGCNAPIPLSVIQSQTVLQP